VFIEKIEFPLGVIHRRAASGRAFKLEVGEDLVPEFTVYVGAEKSELRGTRPVEPGKWTHLAVTYEFKSRGHCTVRMFVNGALTATRNDFSGPPNAVSDPVYVGQTMSAKITPRAVMKWRIDDLGVFPRALTGVEINALAK
jgi:Concanavalin A-like lectin/glucanases superfamily